MKRQLLEYDYPENLVATEPSEDFRIMLSTPFKAAELPRDLWMGMFNEGDVLVVNDTKVEARRVFTPCGREILFAKQISDVEWEVLFPVRGLKVGDKIDLPTSDEFGFEANLSMELIEKGLPQKVRLSAPLTEDYFTRFGEFALPPYIQKARDLRHMQDEDKDWYQTGWAKKLGSSAAPTASLHFSTADLEMLSAKGVHVVPITLHVGLGTFMPVKADELDDHKMHAEWAEVSEEAWAQIQKAKAEGRRVYALGTTVTRTLESIPKNKLQKTDNGYAGETDLFIQPGFDFEVVDVLMTNFHQPESTLLALVMAFAGIDRTQRSYSYAVRNKFRLFSYGDLSIWQR
jgi:S-adenosylmethionine:tRNA ribosyltransferase-isomerase